MRVVLALDLGTTGCKGALYTAAGERAALAFAEYAVQRPAAEFVEQDPRDYVEAARAVHGELAGGGAIAAIGISTQTPTLVFCGESGPAVAPAILWQDSRAHEEAQELLRLDPATRCEWFGMDLPIGAASAPAKLLWMKRHRPEAWRATRWVVQPKDYVAAQLTGCFATDRWCAKGLAHLNTGEVHPDWLVFLGKSLSPSPPAMSPSAIAGSAAGTPVIAGWSDALAGILATGALDHERRGFVLAGTSEIIGMSRRGGAPPPGLYRVPPDLLEGRGLELHFGPTQAGGDSLNWLAGLFGKSHEEVLAALRPGLTPIVFRPYLRGERAPYWDHTLAASIDGLRAEHGFADFTHAVLQGVALQERLVLECAEAGEPAREVVLAGGAARHSGWNRLRADILQRRVLALRDTEASLRGVALLAWSAVEPGLRFEEWFGADAIQPDAAHGETAAELFARFRLASTP